MFYMIFYLTSSPERFVRPALWIYRKAILKAHRSTLPCLRAKKSKFQRFCTGNITGQI